MALMAFTVHAETLYFTLESVWTDRGDPMTGIFAWTYSVGNFENGTGQFVALDIPATAHDHTDLRATFDIGHSIELTLTNNVDSDGIDISLFLDQPLTPTNGAPLDLTRSKYDIGGDGFYAGVFISGAISPVHVNLTASASTPGLVTLAWTPDIPGFILQQTPTLTPPSWTNAPSGSSNPSAPPLTASPTFYRAVKP